MELTSSSKYWRFAAICLLVHFLSAARVTGFFSCERCVVKGKTVENTRIFSETDCEERTLQTFREKSNLEHHLIKEDIVHLHLIKFL